MQYDRAKAEVQTYVKTPSSGLVVSLAKAKKHLHVDDETFPVSASLHIGSANSQLNLTAREASADENSWALHLVGTDINQVFDIEFVGGLFKVTLATDGSGVSTTTPNDIITAIQGDEELNALVTANHGDGDGTATLAVQSASFSGGVDGTSLDDDLITSLSYGAQQLIEQHLNRKLLTQSLVQIQNCFPCQKLLPLMYGPVQSLTTFQYYDQTGTFVPVDPTIFILDIRLTYPVIALSPFTNWPWPQYGRHNAVEIEYVAGYESVDLIPDPIKLAIKLLIGHLYSNRESVLVSAGLTAVELPQGVEHLIYPWRDIAF